nr:hypothetical protein BaRGS_019574 [Batillaria attramentaria]
MGRGVLKPVQLPALLLWMSIIRLDQPLRINVAISDSGEGQPVVLSFDLVGRTANLIVNGPTEYVITDI